MQTSTDFLELPGLSVTTSKPHTQSLHFTGRAWGKERTHSCLIHFRWFLKNNILFTQVDSASHHGFLSVTSLLVWLQCFSVTHENAACTNSEWVSQKSRSPDLSYIFNIKNNIFFPSYCEYKAMPPMIKLESGSLLGKLFVLCYTLLIIYLPYTSSTKDTFHSSFPCHVTGNMQWLLFLKYHIPTHKSWSVWAWHCFKGHLYFPLNIFSCLFNNVIFGQQHVKCFHVIVNKQLF